MERSIFSLILKKYAGLGCRLKFKVLLLTAFVLLSFFCKQITCSRVPPHVTNWSNKEMLVTRNEKFAFEKFKAMVHQNITASSVPTFLKQDIFLLRWLRAKNFNVVRATQDMSQFLSLVERTNVDKLRHEDWSDMNEFPYHVDAIDRELKPVAYMSFADGWDLRKAVLQGKRERILRLSFKMTFDILEKLSEVNIKHSNVTQYSGIINADGINLVSHGCVSCVRVLLNILEMYERFIPGCVQEVIIINASQAWRVLWQMAQPALSADNKKIFQVFGSNRSLWKTYINSKIHPNQLPVEYGGNKRLEY